MLLKIDLHSNIKKHSCVGKKYPESIKGIMRMEARDEEEGDEEEGGEGRGGKRRGTKRRETRDKEEGGKGR